MASVAKRRTSQGPRYDVRYRTPVGDVRSRTFRTRRDAERFRSTVEADKLRGAWMDPRVGRLTFGEWWEKWWPTTANLRPSTRARDESYWRARIEPALGTIALDRLDRSALRAWVAQLSSSGLSPATVHKAVQIVSKALRAAVDDGRIARNPAERLPVPRVERGEPRFLTPRQVAQLGEAIEPHYRALVFLGAYGGLRLGEMLALRRGRLDLLRGRAEVLLTLAEVSGRLVENAPKTRAGRRTVPLPRVAVDALDRHVHEWPGGPDDLVFAAPQGGPVRAGLWRRRVWAPAVQNAGLSPLRPHDLRHSAVALWIAAGATPTEIAARAGHASVVTVLDRYGHLLPGSEERVNAALDELAEV
jgi:integrase